MMQMHSGTTETIASNTRNGNENRELEDHKSTKWIKAE
jgi:hypothetical protein